jgi:hypothetical protein
MTNGHKDAQAMKRYLLREMSAEERAQFEERYLADPELFEELAALEDQMIRSYLRGKCSAQEKTELENRMAVSPDWRKKVEFERSLMEHVSSLPISAAAQKTGIQFDEKDEEAAVAEGRAAWPAKWLSVPALRFAAVAVGLVLVAGGAWLITVNLRLRQQLSRLQRQNADLVGRQQELQQQLAALMITPPPTMPPFILTSHMVRDIDRQKPLVIPPGIASVPLQLWLDPGQDRFPGYSAALETPDGTRLWQQSNLQSQSAPNHQPMIAIELPAAALKRGSYVLNLSGVSPNHKPEEVAVYIFRVARS